MDGKQEINNNKSKVNYIIMNKYIQKITLYSLLFQSFISIAQVSNEALSIKITQQLVNANIKLEEMGFMIPFSPISDEQKDYCIQEIAERKELITSFSENALQ